MMCPVYDPTTLLKHTVRSFADPWSLICLPQNISADPRPNKMQDLCLNFAGRYFNREQGFNSSRLDRRYVHSRFRMVRSITTQRGVFFTSCDFTACATGVIVGVDSGEVRVYSNKSGYTYTTQACQDGGVANVKTSKNGALLLTSASRLPPKSKIWNIIEDNQFTLKMEFFEEDYVEFSKLNEDKILATSEGTATIYDAHTGQLCATFHPSVRNRCMQNRATFSPCDQLILSDGVLWDFNSGDEIHIFDMEHQAMSGVFHPNGVEIVANVSRPNNMHELCSNFTDRYIRRQQGYNTRRLDRRYVHSKLCLEKCISASDASFLSCAFTSCATSVVVGLANGVVNVYNNVKNVCATHHCHPQPITSLKTSKYGELLLTSCFSMIETQSIMWNIERNQFSMKSVFPDHSYMEFSKLNEDKLLGTSFSATTIYDTQTGMTMRLLRTVPELEMTYITFSPQNVIFGKAQVVLGTKGSSTNPMIISTALRTLDSYDYSWIKTEYFGANIFNFSINKYGTEIVLIKNKGLWNYETDWNIYEVGKHGKHDMTDDAPNGDADVQYDIMYDIIYDTTSDSDSN
ncbi:Protein mahjong [Pseudolycoriella hygida]|uniref:Protein mahjong n=1 Tax=Pseudolycoriella hygida TaxID=35572 RepID=A0A9Q0N9J1_9DIPT|nr:Protein mahjong [Pseudolycoriella hygida]